MGKGDISRGGFLEALGNLLDRGVQVVLMYETGNYVGNYTNYLEGLGTRRIFFM